MEPLFINKYIQDGDMIREIYNYQVYKRNGMGLFYPLAAVMIVLIAVVFAVLNRDKLIYVLVLAALYGLLIFVNRININRIVRQNEERSGGAPNEITLEIYEGKLCLFSRQGENEFDWDMIKKTVSTKNLVLIQTRAGLLIPVAKNGFVKGTYQTFCDYLRQKQLLK